jgi:AmiR/NasT family two-component response regulator
MPKKVLIIDDDPIQVNIFRAGLENHNFVVATNHIGMNVPLQIEKEMPDIILLDILFPETSGLNIAEYLYQNNYPYIFISGIDDKNTLRAASNMGALGFLIKPINITQLVVEIETAVNWHNNIELKNRRHESINASIENSRKISLAVGLMMARYELNENKAFEILKQAATHRSCRSIDIANQLIDHHQSMQQTSENQDALNDSQIMEQILIITSLQIDNYP